MDGVGSGSWPMTVFSVEPAGSATRELVILPFSRVLHELPNYFLHVREKISH